MKVIVVVVPFHCAQLAAIGGEKRDQNSSIRHKQVHVSENMKELIHFIDTYYMYDLSLDQLSKHIQLHPNYISALFRKEMGVGFIQYLRSKRILKAMELIGMHPSRSIHTISEEVGFENVRHFFNVFKKYCGMTPGEYRQTTIQGAS